MVSFHGIGKGTSWKNPRREADGTESKFGEPEFFFVGKTWWTSPELSAPKNGGGLGNEIPKKFREIYGEILEFGQILSSWNKKK